MANRLSLAGMTLLVAATTLTACMTEEQLRAEWETRCVGYGFKRGTVSFAQCLQNEFYRLSPAPGHKRRVLQQLLRSERHLLLTFPGRPIGETRQLDRPVEA